MYLYRTLKNIQMKKILTILYFLITFFVGKSYAQPIKELEPYTTFLNKQHLSAKDYIIQLFDKYDIVIFGERQHDELTQYDLLLSVIGSKEFRNKVGNIFMEIGGSNFDTPINEYLLSENLTKQRSIEKALAIQRNMSWYPLWDSYNYHYFLTRLYEINKSLSPSEKLQLHPTDIAIDWQAIQTVEDLKTKVQNRKVQLGRDSVMAKNIINKIEALNKQEGKRKKYFIIMNAGHSGKGEYAIMGSKIKSATSYIFDKYPTLTANVITNYQNLLFLKNPSALPPAVPILNGKWDAAFESLGIDDKGFDIKNSPLDNQIFENLSMADSTVMYKDVYTGYVFYKSAPKHENVTGVSNIVTNTFEPELIRRWKLWTPTDTATYEAWKSTAQKENIVVKRNLEGLSEYWRAVVQWLKPE